MELSQSLVRSLVESSDQFPIDLELAVDWIGYSSKQAAKKKLTNNFEEGADYLSKWMKTPQGGRPSEQILLTIDCFKSLAMMAGTDRGKEVRQYFLNCERDLKQAVKVIDRQSEEIEKLRLQLELAKTQERLMAGVQTLEIIAPGLGQLVLGRQDVEVERIVTVEKHVVVDQRGRVVHEQVGQSPTTVAKSLGMKSAKDLKDWLQSIKRLDLLEESQTIVSCHQIAVQNIPEIRRLWQRKKGGRQRVLGEFA